MKNTKNFIFISLFTSIFLFAGVFLISAGCTCGAGPVLSATPDKTSVTVSWKTDTDTSEHEMRYSTSPITIQNFRSGTLISSMPSPLPNITQTVTINGLASDTTYYFGYKSISTIGEDFFSSVSSRTLQASDITPPGPVTNLTAMSSETSVILTWKAPQDTDLSEYEVRYSPNAFTNDTFSSGNLVSGSPLPIPNTNQTVTVSGLTKDTTYYFGIRVLDTVGNQSAIVFISSKTTNPTQVILPPPPVTELSGTATTNSITLSWKTPSDPNLSELQVRYSTSLITLANFAQGTNVSNVPLPLSGQTQTVGISGLSSNTAYYFGVIVVNTVGATSTLTVTSITTQNSGGGGGVTVPPPVSNFSATPSTNCVVLTWNTPSDLNLSEFALRYNTSEITTSSFKSNTLITNAPLPQSGKQQTVEVCGLSQGTQYYFGIKVLNVVGTESSLVTTSAKTTTSGGGGGGGGGGSGYVGGGVGYAVTTTSATSSLVLPKNPKVLINNGATSTFSRTVLLALSAENAKEMLISNVVDFVSALWAPYSTSATWTLKEGYGEKTVYAKFRNTDGVSSVATDTISYISTPVIPEVAGAAVVVLPPKKITFDLVDFNDVMVGWGTNVFADVNEDGVVNTRDAQFILDHWSGIPRVISSVKLPSTTIYATPSNTNAVEGDIFTVHFVVDPKGVKNYTAKLSLTYPADLLELKNFTYLGGWVPLMHPGYDEEESGKLIKTAGFPGGFSKFQLFGTATFLVKNSGKGTLFATNDYFVLDRNSQNVLLGIADESSLVVFGNPSERAQFTANLLMAFGASNWMATLMALMVFLIVYGISRIFQLYYRNHVASQPVSNSNQTKLDI